MTDLEYKSLKVLERIMLKKNDKEDPPMAYENKSDDPENNMVISVFVSSFDYYRATIPYTAFGDAGGSVMITRPLTKGEIKFWGDSKFFVLSKIISIEYFETVKEFAKQLGAILIYDLDDNLHEVEPWNYAYHIYDRSTDRN